MTVMNDAVRAAISEDANEFDMLLGPEPYKRRFARTRAASTPSAWSAPAARRAR